MTIVALASPVVVAHQGGWDEVLLFAGPVLLALIVLRWADRRAKARTADDEERDASV